MGHLTSKRVTAIVGRLNRGDRLPDGLLAVARAHGVQAGRLEAIGAVTSLEVTEYDPAAQKYKNPLRREGMTEMLALLGNFSLRDGQVFAHLHFTGCHHEAGETRMIAGHLTAAEVFVCEFHITVYEDLKLVRQTDPQTGLALWAIPEKE